MVAPPELIADRYRLQREISSGGVSLFTALDEESGREIMVVTTLQRASNRMARDARAASALTHPAIGRVIDHGLQDGMPFVVMEQVEGSPLHDLLAVDHLDPRRAIRICVQVLQALEHAHEAGLVHGALDAHVVLVSERDRVRVAGLGLGLAGQPAADIRAAGLLLREMLPPQSHVALEHVVEDASQDPPRYRSAAAMRRELEGIRSEMAPAEIPDLDDEEGEPLEREGTVWPIPPGRNYDPTTLGRRVIAAMIALALLAIGAFLWRAITRANEIKEQRQESPLTPTPETSISQLGNPPVATGVTATETIGWRGTLDRPSRMPADDDHSILSPAWDATARRAPMTDPMRSATPWRG
ncbi:MAG: protein kinase [Actinomycetota bacterium]|nr:protein kinase [Actinomycetota bacterium]